MPGKVWYEITYPIGVEVPGRAPLKRATVLEETLMPLEGEEADVGGVRGVTCRMI